jgi:hypothetical protein
MQCHYRTIESVGLAAGIHLLETGKIQAVHSR